MKRLVSVALSLVLLATVLTVGPVSAQGVWNTGIDVQNLSGTDGTLVVAFYNANGDNIGNLEDTISAWGGVNFYLPAEALPSGQFSAVVSSSVEVAAVSSQANYDLGGADMYLGTAQPENTLSFPLVYRNHTSGLWNSKLIIQNASGTQQTVTLNLYTVGQTTVAASATASIAPYASRVFDISDAQFAAFGPYGSAIVTGSQPLAGVSQAIRNPGTGRVAVIESEYRAFGAAQQGQTIVAPLVYKNYNLWTTGINVLNKGAQQTTVSVQYTNANPAITGGPWTVNMTLAGNAMGTFFTPNHANLPDGFYGSAVITSNTTDVAIVVASQRYRPTGAEGVAYEGSIPGEATACVSLPITHNRPTWKTGINILNRGNSTANVTINYYSTAPGIPDAAQTLTIPAGQPLTVYMPTDMTTQLGFYGAADVKSTNGQPLLVNVANSRADQGVASNYAGINYTCP
jgi:hypothetical protein